MSFRVGDRVVYIIDDDPELNFERGARGEVIDIIYRENDGYPYMILWDEEFDESGHFSEDLGFAENELMLECEFDNQDSDEPLLELDIKELFV